jgi:hypothetical protein
MSGARILNVLATELSHGDLSHALAGLAIIAAMMLLPPFLSLLLRLFCRQLSKMICTTWKIVSPHICMANPPPPVEFILTKWLQVATFFCDFEYTMDNVLRILQGRPAPPRNEASAQQDTASNAPTTESGTSNGDTSKKQDSAKATEGPSAATAKASTETTTPSKAFTPPNDPHTPKKPRPINPATPAAPKKPRKKPSVQNRPGEVNPENHKPMSKLKMRAVPAVKSPKGSRVPTKAAAQARRKKTVRFESPAHRREEVRYFEKDPAPKKVRFDHTANVARDSKAPVTRSDTRTVRQKVQDQRRDDQFRGHILEKRKRIEDTCQNEVNAIKKAKVEEEWKLTQEELRQKRTIQEFIEMWGEYSMKEAIDSLRASTFQNRTCMTGESNEEDTNVIFQRATERINEFAARLARERAEKLALEMAFANARQAALRQVQAKARIEELSDEMALTPPIPKRKAEYLYPDASSLKKPKTTDRIELDEDVRCDPPAPVEEPEDEML